MTRLEIEKAEEYVKGQLPREEILAQLAEEAAELAQAAMKLRRAYDGTNPTPVSIDEANEKLKEELADVLLVGELLELNENWNAIEDIMERKLKRWKDRLETLKNSTKLEETR